jgi:hypothetical protein
MCDLLHIADAIWCPTRNCYLLHVPCDLASDLLCDWVHAIWCMRDFCATAKRTRNRTPNRICDLVQNKIESDSCGTPNRRYSKSHLRYTANRTCNRTRNRSCNQPLMNYRRCCCKIDINICSQTMLNHIHQRIWIESGANHVLLYCCPSTPGKSYLFSLTIFKDLVEFLSV